MSAYAATLAVQEMDGAVRLTAVGVHPVSGTARVLRVPLDDDAGGGTLSVATAGTARDAWFLAVMDALQAAQEIMRGGAEWTIDLYAAEGAEDPDLTAVWDVVRVSSMSQAEGWS